MSEDFEPAIAGEMEPESATGDAPSDDGGPDEFEASAPAGELNPRRGRSPSERTRELFAKAAAEMKKQRDAEGDIGETGEYDEGYTPPADRPGPAAALAPAAAPTPAAPAEQPPAPAPSLDPAVAELQTKLRAREAELVERERGIAEREASGDFAKYRDAYTERGSSAIVELLKGWTGAATPEEIQSEVADLITELSGTVLGVPIPADMKSAIEARRAVKTVKAHTARLSKREQEIEAKRAAAEEAATEQRAVSALASELASDVHRKSFPFLAAEDDAAAIVFDVIKTQHKRDGTMLQWTDAAKKANEYLETKWRAEHGKRAHLLSAQLAKAGEAAAANETRNQGDHQRRSNTLTNAQASTSTTPPPPRAADEKWTRENHRNETKRKFRAAFRDE